MKSLIKTMLIQQNFSSPAKKSILKSIKVGWKEGIIEKTNGKASVYH